MALSASTPAAADSLPPAYGGTVVVTGADTIPMTGCITAHADIQFRVRSEADTTTYTVSLLRLGADSGRTLASGTQTGSALSIDFDLCHGVDLGGRYSLGASEEVTHQVGSVSLVGSDGIASQFDAVPAVSAANLALSSTTLESPESCGDVPLTASQTNLLADETWTLHLQVLYPGATYWRESLTTSGTGPFTRTVGLYLCPTDPTGTYTLRADYTVSDAAQVVTLPQTISSTVDVTDPIVEDEPIVETAARGIPSVVTAAMKAKRAHGAISIRGTVKRQGAALADAKVKIQKRVGDAWVTVKVVRSSKAGGVSYSFRSAKKLTVRIKVSGYATTPVAV